MTNALSVWLSLAPRPETSWSPPFLLFSMHSTAQRLNSATAVV